MDNFVVIYDACVLYPAELRDLLMYLALTDIFKAKWTDEILDECFKNIEKNRPDLDSTKLARTRNKMNHSIQDCLVTNYQAIIPTLELPDPNDRHVLAAAIKADAELIITLNLKDFPNEVLKQYNIQAVHPDPFLKLLIEDEPAKVLSMIKIIRQQLKNPPKSAIEYINGLLNPPSLPLTASALREYKSLI